MEMKTENKEIKEIDIYELEGYVKLWKKYDKSYFWSPAGNSRGRRSAEENNTYHFEFSYDKHNFVMDISMSQSAKHVYVTRSLMRDGNSVTIRALTKYIKGVY